MSYYPTLAEDLARAKEILAKGSAREEFLRDFPAVTNADRDELAKRAGGTIYGADTYAAYKLLESFVAEIEQLEKDYAEAVRLYRERDAQASVQFTALSEIRILTDRAFADLQHRMNGLLR